MQINSIAFLMYFLPAFLLVFYMVPRSWRSWVLVWASLIFYGFNCRQTPWMLALLLGLTLLSYGVGYLLIQYRKRWLLAGMLTLYALILVFFKLYRDGNQMPAGLSFYLFQLTAFLAESCSGKLSAFPRLGDFAASVTMFPKLLSGPICDPAELTERLRNRERKPGRFRHGLQELIIGLSMKVLVADRLGGLWAQAGVVGYESISVAFSWTALAAFALRLYLDFWGYSLMALGLGKMVGVELPKNFDQPYASTSVSEFYRRWHVTLGLWFRRYVYIPLGGSRKGMLRTLLNLTVVWTFTGLWHGVGGNYLIWAGFLLLCILMERLWLGKLLKKLPWLGHIYTPLVILISWLPFAVGDMELLVCYLGRMFGCGGPAVNPLDVLLMVGTYHGPFVCGLLLATPLPARLFRRFRDSRWMDIAALVLFWVVIYALATGDESPFLYYHF